MQGMSSACGKGDLNIIYLCGISNYTYVSRKLITTYSSPMERAMGSFPLEGRKRGFLIVAALHTVVADDCRTWIQEKHAMARECGEGGIHNKCILHDLVAGPYKIDGGVRACT